MTLLRAQAGESRRGRASNHPRAARARVARRSGGRLVDEELILSDTNGQDVGHVVIGDGIAIAIPVDEAIDSANTVDVTFPPLRGHLG